MINSRIVNISLIITGFLSLLLVLSPQLDISFSQIFFTPESGFLYKKNFIVFNVYKTLPGITKLFVFICSGYLAYIAVKYGQLTKVIRSGVFFLFISAIIGPGLVVNTIFKENFGRARPVQIEFFNGTKEFTPAFKLSNQCATNCSFSSGHAAMAFFFTIFAYISRAGYFNKVYVGGLIFGLIVGLSRIMMGGHFLSDVMVSAFVVLFLNHIIFILWQRIVILLKK